MHIIKQHDFGEVRAYELGYGPVGKPLMNVFFYQVGGALIDTGQPNMRKFFAAIIEPMHVEMVLLTHHHEDHSGNAALARVMKNVPVYGHPFTVEKMKKRFRIFPYQRYAWGTADPVQMEAYPDSIECGKYLFTPVHTPGHSRDHTALLETGKGWLFSGDLFLGTKIKYFRADERMGDAIESLERVLRLDFDTLYCAHNPQLEDGKKALAKKLDFLKNFQGLVLRLHREGHDLKGIVRRMGQKEVRLIKLITCGNVSMECMVRSSLAGVATLR